MAVFTGEGHVTAPGGGGVDLVVRDQEELRFPRVVTTIFVPVGVIFK